MSSLTKEYLTVIPRISNDERTVAVVKFKGPDNSTLIECLRIIRQSVEEWLGQSKAGKSAWEDSSEDFNWGDLSNYTEDIYLKIRLLRNRIADLSIEPLVDCNDSDETYDSIFHPKTPDGYDE